MSKGTEEENASLTVHRNTNAVGKQVARVVDRITLHENTSPHYVTPNALTKALVLA